MVLIIAFVNENHLYVADAGKHRVQKFDVDGNYLLQFGGLVQEMVN